MKQNPFHRFTARFARHSFRRFRSSHFFSFSRCLQNYRTLRLLCPYFCFCFQGNYSSASERTDQSQHNTLLQATEKEGTHRIQNVGSSIRSSKGRKGKKTIGRRKFPTILDSISTDRLSNQSIHQSIITTTTTPIRFYPATAPFSFRENNVQRREVRESVIPFQFIHRENCFFVKGGEGRERERERENYYPFLSLYTLFYQISPPPLSPRSPTLLSRSNKLYS